jgi:hypothetical protein
MRKIVIEMCPDRDESNLYYGRLLFKRLKYRHANQPTNDWERAYFFPADCPNNRAPMDEKMRRVLEGLYRHHRNEAVEKIQRFPRLRSVKKQMASSSSSQSEEDVRDPGLKKQRKVVSEVTRTKWGTRIYSNDGKHFFNVGVWKSKGYPGYTTIRLSVAGKNLIYTLDNKYLEALRSEISRGMPT